MKKWWMEIKKRRLNLDKSLISKRDSDFGEEGSDYK